MTIPVLDDLDRKLIDVLSKDARISNRKIAADLGVTEGTVRGRRWSFTGRSGDRAFQSFDQQSGRPGRCLCSRKFA